PARMPDSTSAPSANAIVIRARSPSERGRSLRSIVLPALTLKLVPEAAHGEHMARVGRVSFDLRAQPAHVHVDQSTVAEVAVAPHSFEQHLATEDAPGARRQLAQQAELGLG